MTRPSAHTRLFIAVYPPREVAEAMGAALERWAGGRGLSGYRRVPIDQIHLTVQFIGPAPRGAVERVWESMARAAGGLGRIELRPDRLLTLPRRPPARLVAAAAEAPPALRELKRRLAVRLARRARRDGGDRFLPHFTLCRFRPPARMPPGEAPLEVPSFPLRELRLVESVLHPEGARHSPVARWPLDGS